VCETQANKGQPSAWPFCISANRPNAFGSYLKCKKAILLLQNDLCCLVGVAGLFHDPEDVCETQANKGQPSA